MVTKRTLLADVWQSPYGGADKTVDVHLSWLRRKLGETAAEPRMLHSVRGVGVKLVAAPRMRRRLALLVAATTSVVLLAFTLPLAVLIDRAATNAAITIASDRSQRIVPAVAVGSEADDRAARWPRCPTADYVVRVRLPVGRRGRPAVPHRGAAGRPGPAGHRCPRRSPTAG